MKKFTVTEKEVAEAISHHKAATIDLYGKPTTVVQVRMWNGFLLTETSTCVNPENYDEKVGVQTCLDKLKDKVWALLGFEKQTEYSQAIKCEGCGKVMDYESGDWLDGGWVSDGEGVWFCPKCHD